MGRPSQIDAKRVELLPIVAKAFIELGYHRATTAELARRCKVQENILYRLWKDKKAMFIAAIDYVFRLSVRVWTEKGERGAQGFSPEAVLDYEAEHLGELGHHRIVFSGLSETDDPEIHEALARMYRNFHAFILERLERQRPECRPLERQAGERRRLEREPVGHQQSERGRERSERRSPAGPDLAAWAIIGLGTVCTIGRELKLLSPALQRRLLADVGRAFLPR
jgi:AcrR family transcriptional regulator